MSSVNVGGIVTGDCLDAALAALPTHPAADITNNDAPFAWNAATQTGNVPQAASIALDATGFTFTSGDGSAPVVYVPPVDTYISAFSIAGNQATITRNDGVTFSATIPTTIDINVQSFSLSGSNLILTETDGTVHTVAIPAETPITGVDSNTVDISIGGGAAQHAIKSDVIVSAAANNLLSATPSGLYATFTETPITGVDSNTVDISIGGGAAQHAIKADVIVSAAANNLLSAAPSGLYVHADAADIDAVTALDGILVPATTVEDALQQIDNWEKVVTNPAASIPIAPVADAGSQPLLSNGKLQLAETNEIIPTIGADGVVRWEFRKLSAYKSFKSALDLPPAVRTTIPYNVSIDDPYSYIVNGVFTAPVDGLYLPYANVMLGPKVAGPSDYSNWNLWQMLNGALYNLVDVRTDLGTNASVDPTVSTTSRSFVLSGGSPVRMKAGDKLSFAVSPANGAATFTLNTSGLANTMSVTYIQK